MKKITFNVVLNEPDQLIHLDLYHPEKGFLVFAEFLGTVLNVDKFRITDINFLIRQTNIKVCVEKGKDPVYEYPEIQNIEYMDEEHAKNKKGVKTISFKFNPSALQKEHNEEYTPPNLIVRRGEEMYFDLEPVGFEGREPCSPGKKQNVNGHICNVKFHF